MENYTYIDPIFDVIKVDRGNEVLWRLKPRVELPSNAYITSRYYSTQGQAFVALGIIESLYIPGKDIDPSKVEFLTKAVNRLISGNDWITE